MVLRISHCFKLTLDERTRARALCKGALGGARGFHKRMMCDERAAYRMEITVISVLCRRHRGLCIEQPVVVWVGCRWTQEREEGSLYGCAPSARLGNK